MTCPVGQTYDRTVLLAGSATRGGMSTFSRGVMAVGAVLALSGAASAQDQKKDPKAEASIAAEFSPVYAVVDRAMSGQGGVSTEYGAATYLVTKSEADGAKTDPAPADAALPFEFRHGNLESVPVESLERAAIGHEWKIAAHDVLEQ